MTETKPAYPLLRYNVAEYVKNVFVGFPAVQIADVTDWAYALAVAYRDTPDSLNSLPAVMRLVGALHPLYVACGISQQRAAAINSQIVSQLSILSRLLNTYSFHPLEPILRKGDPVNAVTTPKPDINNIATQAAYLTSGANKWLASPGAEQPDSDGHHGMVGRLCTLAVLLDAWMQTNTVFTKVGHTSAWPGVLEYEVTEPMGSWLMEHYDLADDVFLEAYQQAFYTWVRHPQEGDGEKLRPRTPVEEALYKSVSSIISHQLGGMSVAQQRMAADYAMTVALRAHRSPPHDNYIHQADVQELKAALAPLYKEYNTPDSYSDMLNNNLVLALNQLLEVFKLGAVLPPSASGHAHIEPSASMFGEMVHFTASASELPLSYEPYRSELDLSRWLLMELCERYPQVSLRFLGRLARNMVMEFVQAETDAELSLFQQRISEIVEECREHVDDAQFASNDENISMLRQLGSQLTSKANLFECGDTQEQLSLLGVLEENREAATKLDELNERKRASTDGEEIAAIRVIMEQMFEEISLTEEPVQTAVNQASDPGILH